MSLSVVLAFDSPLDQYFMQHPNQLFCRPVEHALVDANNANLLQDHLTCGAQELPIDGAKDKEFFGEGLSSAVDHLVKTGELGMPLDGQGQMQNTIVVHF